MAGSTSPKLRLFVVRHGETDDNLNQIIQGHIDTPLNGRGELQTRAAQDGLADVAFDACWSSDLSRASKTAEIILAGQPSAITAKLDARGREKYLGALQGTTYWTKHSDADIATCEPRDVFMARLLDFLDNEVLASAARMMKETCKDVTVLLVSHSTPVKIYMQLFANNGGIQWTDAELDRAKAGKFEVRNCAVTELHLRPNAGADTITSKTAAGSVIRYDDAAHLASVPARPANNPAADSIAADLKAEAMRRYAADTTV